MIKSHRQSLRGMTHRSSGYIRKHGYYPQVRMAGHAVHTLTSRKAGNTQKAVAAMTLAAMLAR